MNDRTSLISKCGGYVREDARIILNKLDASHKREQDSAIMQQLFALDEWHRTTMVYGFVPQPSEVDICAALQDAWQRHIPVALPRVNNETRRLDWYRVSAIDDFARRVADGSLEVYGFAKSSYGIWEPTNAFEQVYVDEGSANSVGADAALLSLALVPGLFFDETGFRVGHGCGFYDKFLQTCDGFSIGVTRDDLLMFSLESAHAVAAHDQPVSCVVTNTQILRDMWS